MSSKTLVDFLVRLNNDAKLRDECKKDTEGTMTKAGLSEEDKAVLRSRDPEKLKQYCGSEAARLVGLVILIF